MTNENEDNEIENAEYDGGVMTMSAKGMTYKSEDNEIETVDYAYRTNKDKLCDRLTKEINKKLNYTIQELDYCDGDCMLFFPDEYTTKHFVKQLREHGWLVSLDSSDDSCVYVDVTRSIKPFIANDTSNDCQTSKIVEPHDLA